MNMKLWMAAMALAIMALASCNGGKDEPSPTPTPEQGNGNTGDLTPADVQDYDKIYMCKEFYKTGRGWDVTDTFYDPLKSSSFYYFGRSKQSEHFIIFWDKDFGTTTPDDATSPYHLDTDSFLQWCEEIYDYYIGTLGFAHYADGEKSYLDQYKFQIYLWHQTEWAAYGSGPEDNVTGCLWVNPEAANDRSTVAHEIGHSFQYQVACDLMLNGLASDIDKTAFRYNQGSGSTFWEQCAQWTAYRMCPDQVLDNYNFSTFCEECNRHFLHESMRYGSYFLQYYWTQKHGDKAVASVWHEARHPDDALETYMKVYGLTNDQFNDEIYDYASRLATWDIDGLREYGKSHMKAFSWNATLDDEGYWQVSQEDVLEATGFNVIRLDATAGETVKAELVGLPNASGYKGGKVDASVSGWKFGFVALSNDGSTRTYGDAASYATAATGNAATAEFVVPSDAKYVYAIVTCAPTEYVRHEWDDNDANDLVWPYKVRFSGAEVHQSANVVANVTMEGSAINVVVDIDTDYAASKGAYEIGSFTLSADAVSEFIGQDVSTLDEDTFVGYDPAGNAADFTSYKPGMWTDASGNPCSWSEGCAYWQWYVWGGKTDKNGSKIWYDHDQQGKGENKGMFIIGTNPDNVEVARGKSIIFHNKITTEAGGDYDFIVTFNFSE